MIALPTAIAAKAFLKRAFPFILAAAVGIILICTYRAGVKAERHRWEAVAAKADGEQRARKADAARTKDVTTSTAKIVNDRKELDDVTRNLPDETPSARRRARICRELHEAARLRREPPPAC